MKLASRLPHIARLLVLLLAVLILPACEQPEEEPSADAAEPTVGQATDIESPGGVQSIDAEGNIAPFGFASRQPVAVADLPLAAPPTPTAVRSELFATNCVACHGPSGNGVEGLGVNLITSEFVTKATDMELLVFLQLGRPANSPDSITGVPMPAFDWMAREDLEQLSSYLKSLQGQ